jgi:hypothetical protein
MQLSLHIFWFHICGFNLGDGKYFFKVLTVNVFRFFVIIPWMIQYDNCLNSIYTVLGILSNLEVI